ncbi:MAG TPA: type II toxin-antitoxin system VapC family toxin [Pyrinomonadaceae bacterium]|nr:type II toxin-antitoxin system VapC family toxin [Pyrinomonadaceae bacterium]
MTNEVFLDTGYSIALSVESDDYHERAEQLAEKLEAEQTRLVTTQAILLEIGNALASERYRPAAVKLLDALQDDALIEIVPLTEDLLGKAVDLFRNRADKEWGLVDCVSFVAMQERGLTEALTPDRHFEQAGFRALLRDA